MIIENWEQERYKLERTVKHHFSELNVLDNPPGILLCQKNGNYYRWQHRYLQDGVVITRRISRKDVQLAEKLAMNLYRLVNIRFLQNQIHQIDEIMHLDGVPHWKSDSLIIGEKEKKALKVYDSYRPFDLFSSSLFHRVYNYPRSPAGFFMHSSPYRQLIIPYLRQEYSRVIDWYLGDFAHNMEHPEHLKNRVELGYNVRSKSEVLEADMMYHEGILFHYEEKVTLSGGKIVYPDFYILITALEKYIWEHFGAMDNENYSAGNKVKIKDYMENNYFPGINMITTYETKLNPLSGEQVSCKIRFLKDRYREAFPDLPADGSFNMYDLANYAAYGFRHE